MVELLITGLLANLLVIGVSFLFLNWASNLTITNAIKVSTITQLGKTAVGFSLIAFSTSLPELTVAFIAALTGGAPLSVGNVLGSNIFNISVIVGLAVLILYLKRPRRAIDSNGSNGVNVIPSFAKSELSSIEFGLFISSLVPMILIYVATATWVVGLILLFIFIGYMYNLSKVRMPSENGDVSQVEKKRLKRYVYFTILGALGVVVSANFLVNSAVGIAQSVGVPESVIGATIVAFGTSLPELTVSLKSFLKGHSGLAFGNIIGSSFVNITLILGITFFVPAVLGSPVTMNMSVLQNLVIFSIITNLFFWYFLSREKIGWREGAIFLFIYIFFIVTTVGAM
jgi:cation:H+ antiporter